MILQILLKKKSKYEKDGSDFEDKISKIDKKNTRFSGLVKKTDFNAKATEIQGKIPSISGLANNSELTAVENKIPDVSSLVDYNTKIINIEQKVTDHDHEKYITTPEFNNLAARVFNARLAQASLITKTDFDTKFKKISDRVTLNKSKHSLVKNEIKKLEKFDAAYFRRKCHFDGDDGTQNYLVFQPMYKYFKTSVKCSWESKGLSNDKTSSITTSNYNQAPYLACDNVRLKLKFVGDLLKQDKITCNYGPVVNIYTVYRLSPSITSDITLENCIFGAVKLTKTLKINTYSGYGIVFDSK